MFQFTKEKKKWLVTDLVLMVVLTLLDQAGKYWAVLRLKDKPVIPVVNGVLELNYLENRGAAFGLLQNQKVFFVLIAVVILFVIAYVLIMMPEDKKYHKMHLLLVMMAAGACGNMIDRIRTDYVVDFISFVIIHFPIFNIADIYVTVATFLFIILFLFVYKENDFAFLSFGQQKKYREIK